MPSAVGFVDNSNSLSAHYNFLEFVKTFCEANGWTVLRYDTTAANRELILKGIGFTGLEEIFIGIRTYQNSFSDFYNIAVATFTGYVSGNTFDTQPGARLSGVPAHNQRIDYWLTLNQQRLAFALKVGTPVYESAYIGKCLPYSRPSQYPYPVVCAGMLSGALATRFSDNAQSMPYKGNRANMVLRSNDNWLQVYAMPYQNQYTASFRDTGDHYHLTPIELYKPENGIYGALDGVYHITGFNNIVENTTIINGATYHIIQDVYRTGPGDYYALRMDA